MDKLGFSAETTSNRLDITILFDQALQFIFGSLFYRLGIPFGRILNCRFVGKHRYHSELRSKGMEMLVCLLEYLLLRDDDYFRLPRLISSVHPS